MHTGSCQCGNVRFEVTGPLDPIQLCHCGQCRKAQGSAFAANIPVQEDNLTFTAGEDQLSAYESSPGKTRYFCPRCGSPICSRTTKFPGVVRLRAGTLDGTVESRPGLHIYAAHKANWHTINDDLPQFAERRPH